MENRYIIIDEHQKKVDPAQCLESYSCDPEFKVFVEREIGIGIIDNPDKKQKFISYAKRFGFDWEPNADSGFLSYDYKAQLMMALMKEYSRKLVSRIGFPIFEVRGANIFDMSHPVVEAYAKLYGSRLFQFESGSRHVVMSYDASYPQFNLAGKYQLSHKNIPFAHFSVSDCYRHEQNGECLLLYRDRRFFMPDLHPYFKDVDEAFAWYPRVEKQIVQAAHSDDRKYHVIVEVGSEESWNRYQAQIVRIARHRKAPMLIKIWRDSKPRYWIINVDYKIVDSLRQAREIACIQIDVGNAQRLGIKFLDYENVSRYPVIIHAAVPGGLERYFYMLFDKFEQSFPLWLHPIQIRLIPVSKKHLAQCEMLSKDLARKNIRVDIEDRNEALGKKVQRAREEYIPYPIVIGELEKAGRGNLKDIESAVRSIHSSARGKAFLNFSWPKHVSQQVR